jgi:fatty acid desaturase
VDDVKSWVDLKMQLTQLEVEARVEDKVNEATAGVLIAIIAALALVFLLIAAAIAIGNWLGNAVWGFLIVAAGLVVLTLVTWAAKPRLVRLGKNRGSRGAK